MASTQMSLPIALFGPQTSRWTAAGLSDLGSQIMRDPELRFLCDSLCSLPSLWELSPATFSRLAPDAPQGFHQLRDFAAEGAKLDVGKLTNVHLAPLTVLSQTVELLRAVEADEDLWRFQSVQGFCVGFLSAAALSSAQTGAEFRANIGNAIRLAACIGFVVDVSSSGPDEEDGVCAVAVQCRKAADRPLVDAVVDSTLGAYISCVTDDLSLTIALPDASQELFASRLRGSGNLVRPIDLRGTYHHPKHADSARILSEICSVVGPLRLPHAQALRWPLRSTADGQVITSGWLHDRAINTILCQRAHWFQTVRMAALESLAPGDTQFMSLGGEACVPPSLVRARPEPATKARGEVAVIGMASRFSGAADPEELWELIRSGVSRASKLPAGRFGPVTEAAGGRQPRPGRFWGNFLDAPAAFDHRFFGISGLEARSMDPQQRLALQLVYEALESAGYHGQAGPRTDNVGCYMGVGSVDYDRNIADHDANAFSATGTLRAFISGRVSHFFGWSGPSLTIDTACSSSAVAIHTACRALIGGECALAVAGGVNVMTALDLYQNLAAASFLSEEGASRAFDADASGYCRGEGAGVLILKSLSRALADGDNILGVIAASAVGNGSNRTPITVPDSTSQALMYQKVLAMADIQPAAVTYVEAHGTGTPVGDPIEYESVRSALGGPQRNRNLFLGSIKDNIGHTEAASGVAAVIKVLLMMKHQEIPKQANFHALSPRIKALPDDRIVVPQLTQPWDAASRVALANNYGAAGSHAAILLRPLSENERPWTPLPPLVEAGDAPRPYPVLLAAKSAASLQSYIIALGRFLARNNTSLGDVAFALSRRQNPAFEYRISFAPQTVEELEQALIASSAKLGQMKPTMDRKKAVLCFGGQSGNTVIVAKGWYDRCDLLRHHLVDTLVGHSFGQLSALCVSDTISLADAFRLVAGRARLIQDTWGPEKGVMLAIECTRPEVENIVRLVNSMDGHRLEVACYNGPQSFVLAGSQVAIAKAMQAFPSFKTRPLNSSHAYHSYATEGILPGYAKIAASVQIRPPRIHVEMCSSVVSSNRLTTVDIVRHTRQPVFFSDAVERIAVRLPSAVWLEAGSDSPVIPMVRRILHAREMRDIFVPTRLSDATADMALAQATQLLWEAGCGAVYWPFHTVSGPRYRHLNLPPYQFETPQHWVAQKPHPAPLATENSLVQLVREHDGGQFVFLVHTAHSAFQHAVRGHSVAGQSLCPASMYMELIAQCVAVLVGEGTRRERSAVQFKNIAMSAPLGTALGSRVSVSLQASSSCSWDFSVRSQPAQQDQCSETEHASGHVAITMADNHPAEDRLQLLAKVARPSRMARITSMPSTTKIAGPIVYQLFSQVVDYADCYRGVASLCVSDNEAAGSVSMPPPNLYGYDQLLCDPFSLDNFLQVAGIHVNCLSEREGDKVFICHQLEEVIFSTSFPAETYCDQRSWNTFSSIERPSVPEGPVKSDIFVYDSETHNMVLAVLGATFQSVSSTSLRRRLQRVNVASQPAAPEAGPIQETLRSRGSKMVPIRREDSPERNSIMESPTAPPPCYHSTVQPAAAAFDTGQLAGLICDMFSAIMEIPAHEIAAMPTLYELGIDSLLVTEVLNEIQRRFDTRISAEEFQQCRDVSDLCRCIQEKREISSFVGPESPSTVTAVSLETNPAIHEPQLTLEYTKAGVAPAKGLSLAAQCKESFQRVKQCYNEHTTKAGLAGFCHSVLPLQSKLVTQYVVEAFAALGCSLASLNPGDIVGMIPYHQRHAKLAPQLYKVLHEASFIRADGAFFRRTQQPLPTRSALTQYGELLEAFPQHALETKLLHSTGHRLAECLSGTVDPVALLFGDATSRKLLGDVYQKAPMFQAGTQALVQFLTLVFQQRVDEKGRELRILEVGAGTGGTTRSVLEVLTSMADATGGSVSYTFTDLSPSLVAAAKRKFSSCPFIKYAVLDVEKAPGAEHMGAYDVVISTNCIHATSNLDRSLSHIKQMLHSDGVLCLVELTRNLPWFDLVFGLLEGWWLFQDGRHHSLADELHWGQCIQRAGFDWVDWTGTDSEESKILRLLVAASRPRTALGSRPLSPVGVDVPEKEPSTQESIVFKRADGVDLIADIYYPRAPVSLEAKRPVALLIHGGGHMMLSRKDVPQQQVQLLLECGFLPISVDYRLCPETTLVEGPMADVADAMAWIRRDLANTARARMDVQINTGTVVAVGWSTGGHLAMTLGWTCATRATQPPEAILAFYCPTDYEDAFWTAPNRPAGAGGAQVDEMDDTIWSGVGEKPITSYTVPNAVDGWIAPGDARSRLALHMNQRGRTLDVLLGGLDAQTRRLPEQPEKVQVQSVSPLWRIGSDEYRTPTFLVHPRADDLIPWPQAWRTGQALRAANVDAQVQIVDDVPHLFDMYEAHMSRAAARRAVAEGYGFLCRHAGLVEAGSVDKLADRLAALWGTRDQTMESSPRA